MPSTTPPRHCSSSVAIPRCRSRPSYSVQAMELAWVALNYLGIERTTTDATVRSVADIHLAWMPWSHSVRHRRRRRRAGVARDREGLGTCGHRPRGRPGDRVTPHPRPCDPCPRHRARPGQPTPRLGLGLYESAPLAALGVEFLYGLACWYVYRGGRGLLAFICLGNLANLSFLSAAVPGPERFLAGRPLLLVTLILVQIVVSLVLVGVLARRQGGNTAREGPRQTRPSPEPATHMH